MGRDYNVECDFKKGALREPPEFAGLLSTHLLALDDCKWAVLTKGQLPILELKHGVGFIHAQQGFKP